MNITISLKYINKSNLIGTIKLVRWLTNSSLVSAKDFVEKLIAQNATKFSVETKYDSNDIRAFAKQCHLDIDIASDIICAGTIELLKTGEVRFNIRKDTDYVLQTIVSRKQAGRILDTFLQTGINLKT